MHPVLAFVVYLLALIVFLVGALWPRLRSGPATAANAACLGLALVTLVPLVQAGQAAF